MAQWEPVAAVSSVNMFLSIVFSNNLGWYANVCHVTQLGRFENKRQKSSVFLGGKVGKKL